MDNGIERTAYGLRETLFDALEGIINGTVSRKDARAIASLSARIYDTAKMEYLELQMMRQSERLAEKMMQQQIEDGQQSETALVSVGESQ